MITIDGKVYRGLEEQVQYLTDQNSEKDKRLNLKLDKETVEGSALYGVQGTEQLMITAGDNITITNGKISAASGGGGTSGVTDVKVNETSVVTSGVANIDLTPYAKETELGAKQDALTAGQNVFIENNVISATNTVTTIAGVAGTITLGDGLSMSGTTLSATGGGGGGGGKYMHLMAGSNNATYRIIWINDSSTILNSQALVTELTNAGYNKATKPWPLVIGAYNGYQLYNVHVDSLTDDLIFTIADGGTAPELGSTSTMKDIVIPL